MTPESTIAPPSTTQARTSPMVRIFLDSLHLDPARFPAEALRGLDDAQWDELINLAAGHRVTAVFYNRLAEMQERIHPGTEDLASQPEPEAATDGSQRGHIHPGIGHDASKSGPGDSPTDPFGRAMDRLRGYATRLTRDNLRKQADLQAVLRRFASEGIPVILLKGAWLAHAVYEGAAVREMVDLDLMVPADDLERAAGVVMALGWRPHRALRSMSIEMRNKHHLPLMARQGSAAIELHWNLTHEARGDYVPPDGFWERSWAIRVAGEPARAMSPEDTLLHLCLHLAYQHMFTFGIRPVLDVALFLRKAQVNAAAGSAPFDWEALTRRAVEYRWHRGVWITLRLARDLLGAPVPDDALERLANGGEASEIRLDDGSDFVRATVARQAGSGGPLAMEKPEGHELVRTAAEQLLALYYARNILSNQMVSMAHKKGIAGKAGHVVRRIFLPRDQMRLLYDIPSGSVKVWLYYPVRIVGLLWRQLGFALGMMRGEEEVMGHVARRERLRQFLQDG